MTEPLSLELGGVDSPDVRRAFERIELDWPSGTGAASGVISVVSSLPPSGANGDTVFLTTDNGLYVWSAGAWHKTSQGAPGAAGAQGPAGATGSTGATGAAGPAGARGPAGGSVFTQVIGDASATSFAVVHGLGSRDVTVSCYRTAAPYDQIVVDVERTDVNTVTVRTLAAPAAGAYTVVVAAPGSTGGGGGGGVSAYTHIQATPATTWNVVHNLGYRPNVAPVDSLEREFMADITYVDDNSLTINLTAATAGKAYLS